MENAVEAMQMAFAVMVFVIALSVSMISFNSAKATSDIVLYAQDETNYYEYQEGNISQRNRIVGIETIIPTLYKYYKENYTVVFRSGNYNETTGKFNNLKPLPIYDNNTKWGNNISGKDYSKYDLLMYKKYNKYTIDLKGDYIAEPSIFSDVYNAIGTGTLTSQKGSKKIFSFDVDEETLRYEPWTGSYEESRKNLDCLLGGKKYEYPKTGETYIDYGQSNYIIGGFINKYKNCKFVETIGEYEYSSTQEEDTSITTLTKQKKKRMYIYTLILTN